jgi:hypothetical protein
MDLRKYDKWSRLDLSRSGYGLVAGSCEHGDEPLGSTKDEEFLDQLRVLLASQKRSLPPGVR